MADKTSTLILDALQRALATPEGLPLLGRKGALFAGNAAGRLAALSARTTGYLRLVRSETHGKATQEICGLTDLGLDFLLDHASPRRPIESVLAAIAERAKQLDELQQAVAVCRETLATMQRQAERTLDRLAEKMRYPERNGTAGHATHASENWQASVLTYLRQWHEQHPNEDCALPELYRQAKRSAPTLTVGLFHDGLRSLHEQGKVYLYPWTGPLYEIPDPALALLVGHAVAFYASAKDD